MDALKKKRTTLRAGFTRSLGSYDGAVTASSSDEGSDDQGVVVAFRMLEQKAIELESTNQAILDLMWNASGDNTAAIEKEMDEADEYSRRFKEAQYKEEKRSARARANGSAASQISTQTVINAPIADTKKYRLPQIELKKFSGELKEWLVFWSLFKKIHEDSSMDKEDKFQYLIQAMVTGSRAAELVNSYPPTADNYDKVIEALKNRFGRDDLLIEVYVRELLQLVLQNAVRSSNQVSLATLYDKIESQLRALESLGITTDKCAAMLFPLVESSLPEELLRAWQRSVVVQQSADNRSATTQAKDRLTRLIKFIEGEVQNEQRISMAVKGFDLKGGDSHKNRRKETENSSKNVPSAAGLIVTERSCLFCGSKEHYSDKCAKAKTMKKDEIIEIVKKKRACFRCLRPNHQSKDCRIKIRCPKCERKHVELMCFPPSDRKNEALAEVREKDQAMSMEKNELNYACVNSTPEVFMQTLKVVLRNDDSEVPVRVVLDPGSQHSYVLKSVAKSLKYEPIGEQKMNHNVFGGGQFGLKHKRYRIRVKSLKSDFACNFAVLDQEIICGEVPTIVKGEWCNELKNMNIELSDYCDSEKIVSVLIGADVYGKLLTGRVKQLKCGLTAVETHLGWTLMGKVPGNCKSESVGVTAISMYVQDSNIKSLWSLDVLGIKDPIEQKTQLQREEEARNEVIESIKFTAEGRYEVKLPFFENHPPLGDNKTAAERRLESTRKTLKKDDLYEKYDAVFKEWLAEGIVEVVPDEEKEDWGHYLPHRHVVKEKSTTPVRPVFDASAKVKPFPSLNECLQKGPNLIELVPSILLRFREGKIGVIADIKKAFLQIGICVNDRNYLRFLWYDKNGEIVEFRHCRVVFGLTSSPFILAVIINIHLESIMKLLSDGKNDFSKCNIVKLMNSFYVDNLVASVDSLECLHVFIGEAKRAMESAGFDLRGWEYNNDGMKESMTGLLGIKWEKGRDTLSLNVESVEKIEREHVTKRSILSGANRIFDPLGFVCPVTLAPRLLLQETWSRNFDWDDNVEGDIAERFVKWARSLEALSDIHIPRCFSEDFFSEGADVGLHTFCDASKLAYAAVSFLRIERNGKVRVSFVQAKSRVAPIKVDSDARRSIPRLELLAATIGIRLSQAILESLSLKSIHAHYWSDSSTVLAWISRQSNWDTFVFNRIKEIRKFSEPSQWGHVPGPLNPADLPSRGCSVKQLIASRWWEGPEWLRQTRSGWPNCEVECDEEEINRELRKTSKRAVTQNCLSLITLASELSLFKRFSSYSRLVKAAAWMRRFMYNSRRDKENRLKGHLTVKEIEESEISILRAVQAESFHDKKSIEHLEPFTDDKGIIRIKTRIFLRDDLPNFLQPLVLPHDHDVVKLLIKEKHEKLKHAGVRITLSALRENFWILRGRRVVREVIKRCRDCHTYDGKPLSVDTGPLPLDRVKDAAVFEVTGVDLAGPVYLKGGTKAWMCIFTCAVYRAVHFELISGLDVPTFMMGLRRLIARRGRPSTVYSDNGTNFTGLNRLFKELDYAKIAAAAAMERIDWKFNPPSAPWWGGFWERLIAILKRLLRRTLKRTCLDYEEMQTVLLDCEAVINSRPITFISDEKEDVVPLTPSHFLQEVRQIGVVDLDKIDQTKLGQRYRYRQKVVRDLRKRFRNEYLGALSHQRRKAKNGGGVRVGDIVLIGSDGVKRMNWPLGRVQEVIHGRDGKVRLARVITAKGRLIRVAIQRIYPLEINCNDDVNFNANVRNKFVIENKKSFSPSNVSEDRGNELQADELEDKHVTTRSGRKIVTPQRLMYF